MMTGQGVSLFAVRVLAVAALAVALWGCFYQPGRIGAAHVKAQQVFDGCEQARQAGRLKTHLAVVECAAPTVVDAYTAAAYPYPDLTEIRVQAWRIGAVKVDAGAVTEAQYRHDLAELDTRLAAEEARRAALTDRARTPTPVSPDTLVAGLPAFAPTPAPPPAPPRGSCLPIDGIKSCP